MNKNSNKGIILEKTSNFALWIYILINIAMAIIFILFELGIGLIIPKFIDSSSFIENIGFAIINSIVFEFLCALIFVKFFKKKYILQNSKEDFLHKFSIMIIILSSLLLVINTINEKSKLDSQLFAIELVQLDLQYEIENDIDTFNKYSEGTEYKDCKTAEEVRNVAKVLKENAITNRLMKTNLCILIDMLASILFIEILVRKENEFVVE